MKKLFLLAAILSTQLIHTSFSDTDGVLRTIYAPDNKAHLEILVTVTRSFNSNEPTITAEPYSDAKYNNAPRILSSTGLQKYLNRIKKEVSEFGRNNS